MKFTKQEITEEDLQLSPLLKRYGLSAGDRWVINENRDVFLYFRYSDRQDMGATRDEWWLFLYRGYHLILRLDVMDINNIDGIKHLKLRLSDVSITLNHSYKETVIQLNDLHIGHVEFFKVLNEAFSVYKSYGYWPDGFKKEYNFQVEVCYEGK